MAEEYKCFSCLCMKCKNSECVYSMCDGAVGRDFGFACFAFDCADSDISWEGLFEKKK